MKRSAPLPKPILSLALLTGISTSALVASAQSSIAYTTNVHDGDTNVEIGLPVSVTMNTAIDSTSVTRSTFYLVDDHGSPVPARIAVSGSTLTLVPQIKLQPLGTYSVKLQNATDHAGNPLPNLSISYTNKEVELGLYFYGYDGACEKYFPGVPNAFYSPTKPTMVFSHGFQANYVNKVDPMGRPNFSYQSFLWTENDFQGSPRFNGLSVHTNHGWLDRGWNTGFLYWTQFADEPSLDLQGVQGLASAEAKIWSFTGPRGSRYRLPGAEVFGNWDRIVTLSTGPTATSSLGQALGLLAADAVRSNTSGTIRIVGHSLGNQMATHVAHTMLTEGIPVERLALLDPAWSNVATALGMPAGFGPGLYASYMPNDGYGDSPAERSRNLVLEMISARGIAVEMYHSTPLAAPLPGLNNNALLVYAVASINLAPWYYGALQIGQKHNAAMYMYNYGMSFDAPAECYEPVFCILHPPVAGPSAATPTWRIKQMMTPFIDWTQVQGRYTPRIDDDAYQENPKIVF